MSGARLGARKPNFEAIAMVGVAAGEKDTVLSCDSGMSPYRFAAYGKLCKRFVIVSVMLLLLVLWFSRRGFCNTEQQ